MLRGARTWMNWNISLERSQCDKWHNQLLPYVKLFIYERKGRSKIEDSKKSKQIVYPVFSG